MSHDLRKDILLNFLSDAKHAFISLDSWNDVAVAGAWDPNTPEHEKPILVYSASKTEAEREAWKWLKNHEHKFVFNSVLPNYNVSFQSSKSWLPS